MSRIVTEVYDAFRAANVQEDLAKAAAGEAQRRCVQDGLQLAGGIGFTWEHDLHLFLRRAKVGELHFGSASHHRRKVARLALQPATA